MSTETKTKFTAVMVDEATKSTLVSLRGESKLSEKQLLSLVTKYALLSKDQILEEAAKIVADELAEKEAKKKERYEKMKATQKEVRAQARILLQEKKKAEQSASDVSEEGEAQA